MKITDDGGSDETLGAAMRAMSVTSISALQMSVGALVNAVEREMAQGTELVYQIDERAQETGDADIHDKLRGVGYTLVVRTDVREILDNIRALVAKSPWRGAVIWR